MKTQTKKLSLKKETLRPLDNNQIDQLDGVVGGTDPISIITISIVTITITIQDDVAA